jgi:hypothetical protein
LGRKASDRDHRNASVNHLFGHFLQGKQNFWAKRDKKSLNMHWWAFFILA